LRIIEYMDDYLYDAIMVLKDLNKSDLEIDLRKYTVYEILIENGLAYYRGMGEYPKTTVLLLEIIKLMTE